MIRARREHEKRLGHRIHRLAEHELAQALCELGSARLAGYQDFRAQAQTLLEKLEVGRFPCAIHPLERDEFPAAIKVHEYAGMTATAREIRGHGCPVLLCGPFTGQIRDPARWRRWVADLGGDPVHLVWVRVDPATLRARIVERASPRDTEKLTRWADFLAATRPDSPPPVPHAEVDNRPGAPPLSAQVRRILAG
jgi:hypothetical protein